MAIQGIILRNFQIHRKSNLNFHEGINIIAGSSDNGKSSVIRAFRWLCENSPRGFSFRRWNTPEKSSTIVSMEVDDTTIERKRNSSDNCYNFENQSYKALKTDVPEIIRDFLGMNEFNIQRQFEGPFIFSKSGSEVARMINSVAGVSVIDDIIKESNKRFRTAKNEVKFLEGMIENKKAVISSNRFFVGLRKELLEKQGMVSDLEETEKDILSIKDILKEVESSSEIMKKTKRILKHRNLLEKSVSLNSSLSEVYSTISSLEEIIEAVSVPVIHISDKDRTRVEKLLGKCASLQKKLDLEEEKTASLGEKIRQLRSSLAREQRTERELKDVSSELESVKKEAGVCPLCGGRF